MTACNLGITGIGGITAVGANMAQSCAAIRAGICGVGEHRFQLLGPDPEWDPFEPLRAAMVPVVDFDVAGPARAIELCKHALDDLIKSAHLRRDDFGRVALLCALPSATEVLGNWQLEAHFGDALLQRTGLDPFCDVRVDASGRAAVFRQLLVAQAIFDQRLADRCLLLAVDTFHDRQRLRQLDVEYRLKSERSPDGFRPGEAAVAMLLEPFGTSTRSSLGIREIGFALEPRPFTSGLYSSARGLQQAIEQVARTGNSDWVLCDLNGESYRAFEWGMLLGRMAPRFDRCQLNHPADCVGDVGAAIGAVMLAHASHMLARNAAPSSEALCWVAGDDGVRAALFAEKR
jgi:3-oxoacyl-[acyl-carrier-protein] synthase-1